MPDADTTTDADNNDASRDLRTWLAGAAIGLALLAVIIAAYSFGWNRGQDHARTEAARATPKPAATTPTAPAGQPSNANVAAGKKLFLASSCTSCHTLADANAKGTVGPNLDALKPSSAMVLAALKNGGTGSGTMPKNLYTGKDAQAVADYVSAAAGK